MPKKFCHIPRNDFTGLGYALPYPSELGQIINREHYPLPRKALNEWWEKAP